MEVDCAAAEVALQVHSGATDVQQAKPLGFTPFFCWCCFFGLLWVCLVGFFCDWDVTKKSP